MKNNTQIFSIVILLAIIVFVNPSSASAQEKVKTAETGNSNSSQNALATIPFELFGNHIYLDVSVNGSAPLSFILDTGASTSVISLKNMEALKLESNGQIPIRGAGGNISGELLKDATLEVAGLKNFKTPLAVAIPLANLEEIAGHKLDGVLGHEFFRSFAVRIDYHKKQLEVFSNDNPEYRGDGEVLPLIFKGTHPHISGKISLDGKQEFAGDFIVDIGSAQSLTLTTQFINDNKLLEKISPVIEMPVSGSGVGGDFKSSVGRIEKLQIGSIEITRPLTVLAQGTAGALAGSQNYIGNIGSGTWKRFNVMFDFKNKRMILEKTSSSLLEEKFNMSGIFVRKEKGDYKIIGLIKNSPAVDAGLQVGDVLHKFNGVTASEFSLEQIYEKFKTKGKMSLEINREGKTINKELDLRILL